MTTTNNDTSQNQPYTLLSEDELRDKFVELLTTYKSADSKGRMRVYRELTELFHEQTKSYQQGRADALAAVEAEIGQEVLRLGGSKLGRNYWTGIARGNNDTLDRIRAVIQRMKGEI